jgi:S-phase kinase-associated protein 1
MVKFQSSEGKDFDVSENIVKMFSKLEVPVDPNETVLLKTTSKNFERVLQFCEYHVDDPVIPDEEDKLYICPWDQEFCRLDQVTLFELVNVAHELGITLMVRAICKTIAEMLKVIELS